MDPLAFIVPVLNRPHRVAPLLDSIEASMAPHPELCHVVFVVDEDDEAELAAIAPEFDGARCSLLRVPPGLSYGAKINVGYRATTAPFIFTGADDLHPHPGWYTAAWAYMADPAIGVVGTVDLCNERTMRGESSTHSLVRRAYVENEWAVADAPDQIYCERYSHDYVDDELVRTAMRRGAYAHAFDSVVEHLHPNVGKAPMDATYELPRARMAHNRRIFMSRRHLWQ